ncbi:hypothetical protein L0F63_002794 [Massospora cicadina]|nr:hypothetical protein L0F63_002794 [Massospora cicadina]
MAWQPQLQALDQIVQTFSAALIGDQAVQKTVVENIQSFHKEADFSNYCVYLFCDPARDANIRFQAGLALKNHILYEFSTMTAANIDFIKLNVPRNIADTNKAIRTTTGSVISGLIRNITLFRWPEILPILVEFLSKGEMASGALSVFKVLVEDCPTEVDVDADGSKPLTNLFPGLISFMESPQERLRAQVIEVLALCIYNGVETFNLYMQTFVTALLGRVQDRSPLVHKQLCRAFVNMLSGHHEFLLPHLNVIAEYMFRMTQADDEEVALEACEFWLAIAEHEEVYIYLKPLIGGLIPVLLKGMVYSEEELLELEESMVDASVPDRDQDIRPHHQLGRDHGHHKHASEDPELDDDDDLEDYDTKWNLRKCSAAALDQLSNIFGNDLLEVLFPLLNEKLQHAEWTHRECGILALGAVAEGCFTGIRPHLPSLVDYLLQQFKDPQPLIRSISCWTVSRYADWYVQEVPGEDHRLAAVLEGLLKMALDTNKRVQEAGCSAFTTLESAARLKLVPYLEPIIGHLVMAFSRYQRKNMMLLYDALSSLAYAVGDKLNQQPYVDTIMPPLIHKWNELGDDNTDLFPLFECLSALILAIGPGFMQYTVPVYQRCVRISAQVLQQDQMYKSNPGLPEPDKDFIIVSLDLLSAIVQGMGEQIFELANSSQPSLVNIVASCIGDDNSEVCQSAYAVLGDLTINCYRILEPHMAEILKHMITNFRGHVQHINLCNNVIWSSGEIALKMGEPMLPYITPLLQEYIPLINAESSSKSLGENLAIALGRFGLVFPDTVAPHLPHFAAGMCKSLKQIEDNQEKDSAFQGLCVMAQRNPGGLQHSFVLFCLAVENFQAPSERCSALLRQVLQMYKELSGPSWDQFVGGFNETTQMNLRARFGL